MWIEGSFLTEPSARFASRAAKELRRELLVTPLPELGLVAANGPNDPEPELVIEDGIVVRMDGRATAEFLLNQMVDHARRSGVSLC